MNRIIKGEVIMLEDGRWYAIVTKEFAPEHGGGTQQFNTGRGWTDIHFAIDDLKALVTVTPAQRLAEAANVRRCRTCGFNCDEGGHDGLCSTCASVVDAAMKGIRGDA